MLERSNPLTLETIAIDFESRWSAKYSLKRMSTSEYVRDRRFKAHCVAVARGSEGFVPRLIRHADIQAYFDTIDWSKVRLVAHNGLFDFFVLAEIYGKRAAEYFCTQAAARHWERGRCRHSLDALCKLHGLKMKPKGVLDETKGLDEIPDEMWPRFSEYATHDVLSCLVLYQIYKDRIVPSERKLMTTTFRMFCDPVFEGDLSLIRESFHDALKERINKIAAGNVDRSVLASAAKFAAALEELGVDVPTKYSVKQKKWVYAFAKSDEDFTDLLMHDDERVATLVAAKLANSSTIGTTRALRMFRLARTGKLAVALHIWGAATDRWSGANKMNFQNFKRKSKLRKSIQAMPGHVLCVGDSSNIEARGTAWFCSQEEMLAIFNSGQDPYNHMASIIYGKPIFRKQVDENGKLVFETEGFVGKQAVLGLGYGMGWKKFMATCRSYGVFLDEELCMRTVMLYRAANYRVEDMWATLTQWSHMIAAGAGEEMEIKGVRLVPREKRIWFPNGTSLFYPHAQFTDDNDVMYRTQSGFKKLYGGKLLENIIQKLSRDVVAHQINEISDRYRIGTMSHDEAVWAALIAEREEALAWGLAQMRIAPSWAQGWPLDAEGSQAEYYSK